MFCEVPGCLERIHHSPLLLAAGDGSLDFHHGTKGWPGCSSDAEAPKLGDPGGWGWVGAAGRGRTRDNHTGPQITQPRALPGCPSRELLGGEVGFRQMYFCFCFLGLLRFQRKQVKSLVAIPLPAAVIECPNRGGEGKEEKKRND